MATLAAVDLGAQSGRVAVGRFDGERLGVTEVHRFPNVPVRVRDTLHWDILRVYRDVLDGLRAAAREAGRVDSVAVDSWGVDFGLIDTQGRLVQNPVHYRDGRRARAMDGVLAQIPARELYDRTGIQLMPINTVFELGAMAADADPALDAAGTMLLIPDLLHYWFCGAATTEFTNATTTQCFDPHAGGWAADLLERIDVPTRLLPDVVQPGTRLAPLGAAVAEETRLASAEVVAVATHDTGSAVAAVPFRQPGSVFISAGNVVACRSRGSGPCHQRRRVRGEPDQRGRRRRHLPPAAQRHRAVAHPRVPPRVWAEEGREHSFDQLVALAKDAPALQSFIDPNDAAFGDPGDMPARVRAFCAHTGQPEPVDPGAVVRCILESLALKHAQTIDLLASVADATPKEIHVVGGGARNELLCRWTADAAGLPVLAGPEEATLLGNMLVQAMALGEISSLAEGRELIAASVAPTAYEPQETSKWQEAKERFAGAVALPTLEVGT